MFNLALLRQQPAPKPLGRPDAIPRARPANDNGAVRRGLRQPTLAESFLEQWTYVVSTAELNAVCCSRRAGKTQAAIARAILVLSRIGTNVHYISLIRRNARKQFWRPLLTYLKKLDWKKGKLEQGADFEADETQMILRTAWGSTLQAASCPTAASTNAVQGDRSDLFMIDECHLPNDDVLALLVAVAEPMLTDTGGQLDLLGLPPEVEPTFFSNALDNDGWARFHWTQFDHDFPRSREKKWASVKERCRKRGLELDVTEAANDNGKLLLVIGPKTNPIVARQYFGKRVRDPKTIAYEYQAGRNDYDPATVNFARGDWRTGWGMDLGFSDHDAISIGKTRWDDPQRRLYVAWWWQRRHLDVFDLADLVLCVKAVLPPDTASGDHGGHGAVKTMKSLERVLRMEIHPKPGDVMTSVGFANDGLRSGRTVLATVDVYTDKIAAAARRIFAKEPKRLAAVLCMLGVDPVETAELVRSAFADDPDRVPGLLEVLAEPAGNLRVELPQVVKSVNPRTKKVEINKRGKHSDLSESYRYLDAGLLQAPAEPSEPDDPRKPTAPDELADYEREQERKRQDEAQKAARATGRW